MAAFEETVDDAVEDHERRCHAIPPPDNSPLSAVPLPDVHPSDDELSHAIEMLDDHDEGAVAAQLGIPLPALQRGRADYGRRFGKFLHFRRTVR